MLELEAMNYWISDLSNRSSGTQSKYKEYFLKFCEFTKKSSDELIEQRKQDLKAEDPREQRAIECLLKTFIVHLKEEGYAPATLQIAFAAVKSFFDSNEYPLHTKRSDYPKGESFGSRAMTKPMIKQILDDSKSMRDRLKMRALILLLKDTGLRVGDVRDLTYGHVADGLEHNLKFIPLQIRTQKNGIIAKTFLGSESIQALKEYLEERRKGTRRLPPEEITHDLPLFKLNRANASAQGKVQRMSRSGLSSSLAFHCQRTGVAKVSAHSFRKFLQTSLDAAGCPPNFTDQMLGHKLINSRDAYSLPTEEMLQKAYEDAYPLIRIYPDKTEVEERVGKLEEQLAEKNSVIASLMSNGAKKTTELDELRVELESLKDAMLKVQSALNPSLAKERQQQTANLKEYLKKHPELQRGSEEKISVEWALKFLKGFREYCVDKRGFEATG